MRLTIDPQGQSGNDGHPGPGKFLGHGQRQLPTVACATARSDHADRLEVVVDQCALDVNHRGWRRHFPQQSRIPLVAEGQTLDPELGDPLHLPIEVERFADPDHAFDRCFVQN